MVQNSDLMICMSPMIIAEFTRMTMHPQEENYVVIGRKEGDDPGAVWEGSQETRSPVLHCVEYSGVPSNEDEEGSLQI